MNHLSTEDATVAEVPARLAGERADRAAAQLFAMHSRSLLASWLRRGALTVDGKAVQPSRRLRAGEVLRLRTAPKPAGDWTTPQEVAFRLVHEDGHLLVVDKPAGVLVHPGAGKPDGTLVNGLLRHRPGLADLPRAGIVHRLDQNTSGLLMVAASQAAHQGLTDALLRHRVARRYLGVAENVLTSGRTIDAPLGRNPRQRTRQQVRSDGRAARTRVSVRERFRAHTYFSAELETGRTHQIRVHMASIGHPLVGDGRYRASGRLPRGCHPQVALCLRSFRRQALHAAELAFAHPLSGEPCRFTAPLPRDMAELLAALRQDLATHPNVS